MLVMIFGLISAFLTAVWLLPADIGLPGALRLAAAAGKLNPVTFVFDWNDRYNFFSGLIGGMFLALAYFGCDQSQVQRYLTGKSIAQSRLSLLFNAVAKIPMQFFILFTGAMVFVFYVYEKPPVNFNPQLSASLQREAGHAQALAHHDAAFEARRSAAQRSDWTAFRSAHKEMDTARAEAAAGTDAKDTNYVFLRFVTNYMPVGIVGLVMAAIFAAAMSTASAEVNSLATVSVIDVYQRFVRPGETDGHYLGASRWLTGFWGLYAVVTAYYAQGLGSLVEAVNKLGSLFYGSMLGVFVLAFFFPRVKGTAAFTAVIAGEAVVFAVWSRMDVAFLWLNVLGCAVVMAVGLGVSLFGRAANGEPGDGRSAGSGGTEGAH
jgi:Na+/proline symporter